MPIKQLNKTSRYLPGQPKFWTGRKTLEAHGNQYWHQAVVCAHILDSKNFYPGGFGLLGYACDEGVRRNQGRVGAAHGPNALREKLGKSAWHNHPKKCYDFGDVICVGKDMEACQEAFSKSIAILLSQGIMPLGLGGGHDMAYAHFMGINQALKNTNKRIGIINFDAHFDLRPVESQPNSGTPFNQIILELKKEKKALDYFAIGIQKASNTQQLFDIAAHENVYVALSDVCEPYTDQVGKLQEQLEAFVDLVDYLYITVDMDGFSSAYAPGVSAPSPLGFSPSFVFKIIDFLLKTKKVIAFDIAELNPKFDRDDCTATLASQLIDFVVSHAPNQNTI